MDENNLDENEGIAESTPSGLTTVYGPPPIKFGSAGNGFDWNRNNHIGDLGVIADLNNIGPGQAPNLIFCTSTPGEIEASYNDWNRVVYNAGNGDLDSEDELTGGGRMTGPDELPVEKLTASRLALLESLNDAIENLPSNAFVTSQESQEQQSQLQSEDRRDLLRTETTPGTSELSNLLVSDNLDESINELQELRSISDATVGGNPQDDLIVDPEAQQTVLGLIDNFILSLEKQK